MHAGRSSDQGIGYVRKVAFLLRRGNQPPTQLGYFNRYRKYSAGKLAAQTDLQPLFQSVPFLTAFQHLDPRIAAPGMRSRLS